MFHYSRMSFFLDLTDHESCPFLACSRRVATISEPIERERERESDRR